MGRTPFTNTTQKTVGVPTLAATPRNLNTIKDTEPFKALPIRGLTREQLDEMRKKKLCYSCDEPYVPGHICKKPQMFMMMDVYGGEELQEPGEDVDHPAVGDNIEVEPPKISLHTLSGHNTNSTIKLLGMVNGKSLRILVDSGSTNNFLDPSAAKCIRVRAVETTPIIVTVADGFKVLSTKVCSELTWTIQGEEFSTNFRVLSLGGVDAVLGVQWLQMHNPVTLDFHKLQVKLVKDGKDITCKGNQLKSILLFKC